MTKKIPKDAVFVALLAMIFLLPFATVKISFLGIPFYLPEIAILVALGFFALTSDKEKIFSVSKKLFFRDVFATVGVSLFIIGTILSLLMHPFSLTSVGMLKSWFFFPVLAAWLLFFEAEDLKKWHTIIFSWFIVLVVTAISSLSFVVLHVLTFDGRLVGMYSSPNFLAFFVAPASLLALYLWDTFLVRDWRDCFKKGLLFLGSVVALLCLFFTHSYGTWGAVALGLLLFLFGRLSLLRFRKKTFLLLVVCIAVLFFVYGIENGSEKWQALYSLDERSSFSSRLMIWQSAGKIISDNPFLGIGVGRFQEVYLSYQQYFPPYLEWAVPQPHNVYLALWLSSGSIGLFGFILLITRLMYISGRTFLINKKEEPRLGALLICSLLLLFLVSGIVDTPYFKNDLAIAFFLLIGLGFARESQSKNVASDEQER